MSGSRARCSHSAKSRGSAASRELVWLGGKESALGPRHAPRKAKRTRTGEGVGPGGGTPTASFVIGAEFVGTSSRIEPDLGLISVSKRRGARNLQPQIEAVGSGEPTDLPVAGDLRSLPHPRRRGPAAAVPRQDGRRGVRGALPPVARRARARPSTRPVDRVGDPTARPDEARRDPEGAGGRGGAARRGARQRSMDSSLCPGVGRYAASATLSVAFGDPCRGRRWRDAPASTAATSASRATARPPQTTELWPLVEDVTPHEHVREWNWAVLDLAATVCLPKVPRCSECPLRHDCAWSRASLDRRRWQVLASAGRITAV